MARIEPHSVGTDRRGSIMAALAGNSGWLWCLALTVTAAATMTGMLANGIQEGNVEAQSSLKVIAVDPAEERWARVPTSPSQKELREVLTQREKSLAEIKDTLGMVLVPTDVLGGFSLSSSELSNGRTESTLHYVSEHDKRMSLDVFQTAKLVRLEVPAGQYREVAVGQHEGYLIDGIWSALVPPSAKTGDQVPMAWDPERVKTLYVTRDGWTVVLLCRYVDNDSVLSDDELIRIAESLQPY